MPIDPEREAWDAYAERFRREVLPNMERSSVSMVLGANVGEFDVKLATEIGAALLLDKPLLLVIPRGREVGPGLRRAADVVVDHFDLDDVGSRRAVKAGLEALGASDAD